MAEYGLYCLPTGQRFELAEKIDGKIRCRIERRALERIFPEGPAAPERRKAGCLGVLDF